MFDPLRTMALNKNDRSQQELLAAIVDSSQDPLVSLGVDNCIVAWNQAAQLLLGFSPAEALGQPFGLIAEPGTQFDVAALTQPSEDGERCNYLSGQLRSKDGSSLNVSLQLSPLRSPSRTFLGTLIAIKDFVRTGRAEQDLVLLNAQLLQSERRFRTLAETLADMLWSVDPHGVVPRFLSPKFGRYTGLAADALTEQIWLELLHPEDRLVAQMAWKQARATRERFQVEFRLRRSDGAFRWFIARGMPVCDERGEIVQWLGTNTDIDDLKRGEEALRRSNEELKQFAYAAAHDLQEPLRNVATCVGMLRRHYEAKLDPCGMEWIDASIEGAHRLYAMVKDLLTFSTIIDDEPRPVESDSVPCKAALETALMELSTEIEQASPDIRIADLPTIAVQRMHAVRLFQNIIGNSLKYRRTGVRPVIEICSQPAGSQWIISVKDNGIGFDPVYANKIFGVFKRLHARELYPGNGIGLAVCERIVAHYGGRIWAEAVVDQGATFHCRLPGVSSSQ